MTMSTKVKLMTTVEKYFAGGGNWVYKCQVAIDGDIYWLYVEGCRWVLNTTDVLETDDYDANEVIDYYDDIVGDISDYRTYDDGTLAKLIATIWDNRR